MKKIIVGAMVLVLSLLVQNAFAFTWTFTGDTNGISPETVTGLNVGNSNFGSPENGAQEMIISGAGTLLPAGFSNLLVQFHSNLSTWDTYNNKTDAEGGGYYDVFAIALSQQGLYWNLASTTTHPLENNPGLIASTPDPKGFYWGGQNFLDHLLETDNSDVNTNFNVDPTKQYYLSVFLQTRSDKELPSWGTISNLSVNEGIIPEPASLSLLGLGLLGIALKKRRK